MFNNIYELAELRNGRHWVPYFVTADGTLGGGRMIMQYNITQWSVWLSRIGQPVCERTRLEPQYRGAFDVR